MDIQIEVTPGGPPIARLAGRLDAMTAPICEQRLALAVAGGVQRLILDCAALDYVSSAGLRVILGTANLLQTGGGHIVFSGLQDGVREVFEMTGLLDLFEVHDSLADALATESSERPPIL